jgi:hypothetical protein
LPEPQFLILEYDILKAAYEVDKTLTKNENSWVNKINEISKLIGLSSLNISTFLFKQKLENYYKVKIGTEISNIKNCGSGKLKIYSKIFTESKQPGYLDSQEFSFFVSVLSTS